MKLKINGEAKTFDGDKQMPILWYLRDELNLTGTKYGCGMAQCGACTVHIDGQAIRSCLTPIAMAENKNITTIEGLGAEKEHPVQTAWKEHNVPQCGFCQPGQMMQAASLLATNAAPKDEEIDMAMAGNICRCGTYPRIREAIKSAAEKQS